MQQSLPINAASISAQQDTSGADHDNELLSLFEIQARDTALYLQLYGDLPLTPLEVSSISIAQRDLGEETCTSLADNMQMTGFEQRNLLSLLVPLLTRSYLENIYSHRGDGSEKYFNFAQRLVKLGLETGTVQMEYCKPSTELRMVDDTDNVGSELVAGGDYEYVDEVRLFRNQLASTEVVGVVPSVHSQLNNSLAGMFGLGLEDFLFEIADIAKFNSYVNAHETSMRSLPVSDRLFFMRYVLENTEGAEKFYQDIKDYIKAIFQKAKDDDTFVLNAIRSKDSGSLNSTGAKRVLEFAISQLEIQVLLRLE